jgi:hypothetical protein
MCFLTFWTYAVRKLLMSRRVACHLLKGFVRRVFKKEGREKEKAVIATTSRASVQA